MTKRTHGTTILSPFFKLCVVEKVFFPGRDCTTRFATTVNFFLPRPSLSGPFMQKHTSSSSSSSVSSLVQANFCLFVAGGFPQGRVWKKKFSRLVVVRPGLAGGDYKKWQITSWTRGKCVFIA